MQDGMKFQPVRKRTACFLMVALFLSVSWQMALGESPSAPAHPPTPATQPIRGAKVVGNTLLTQVQIDETARPFIGKELNLSTINDLMNALTQAYRSRGFFLARAYVPEQEIKNGEVVVAVVEGKIGEISITGNEYYLTSFIQKHFPNIKTPEGSRIDLIKQSVLVLNRYPDLQADLIFRPGNALITTDLQLMVKDTQPVHLAVDYNNFGSKAISRDRFGMTFSAGNLFDEGHLFSLRGVTGSPTRNIGYIRATYMIPFRYQGDQIQLAYTNGDFDVGHAFDVLNIRFKTQSGNLFYSHPFLMAGAKSLSGKAGLEINDFDQSVSGATTRDRIRVIRGQLDYNRFTENTRDIISTQLSQGLGTFLGGMGRFASASRLGADNQFTKATIEITRARKIPQPYWLKHPFILMVIGGVQWSSDNLVSGEQFSLGGPDSVRGYPVGEFLGDHGYRISTELRGAPLTKENLLQGVLFLDHGGTFTKKRSTENTDSHALTGMGIGARFDLPHDFILQAPGPEKPGYLLPGRLQGRLDIGFPVGIRSSTGANPTPSLSLSGSF
jgi:hemolysin activation/secretion protein